MGWELCYFTHTRMNFERKVGKHSAWCIVALQAYLNALECVASFVLLASLVESWLIEIDFVLIWLNISTLNQCLLYTYIIIDFNDYLNNISTLNQCLVDIYHHRLSDYFSSISTLNQCLVHICISSPI
jgi:hypothetical protein